MKPGHQAGHSLLELLAVITILAVLASMAMASYQNHIRKARRADAKSVLLQTALFMERNYTEANRYDRDSVDAAIVNSDLPYPESPADGNRKFYDIQFLAGSPTTQTFTLEAAPKNGQQKDTLCATLRIDEAGIKSVTGTGSVGECWAR